MSMTVYRRMGLRAGRTGWSIVVSLATLTTITMAPGIASAGSPSPARSSTLDADRTAMLKQAPLNAAASAIRQRVDDDRATGFLSIETARDGALVLRWKGVVPAGVTKVIESVAAKGIRVRVAPARFSRQELRTAAGRVEAALRRSPFSYFTIYISGEGTGLSLDADASHASLATALSTASINYVGGAQPAAGPSTRVPVTAAPRNGPVRASSGRLNDSAPWWGGARIVNHDSAGGWVQCTSGFGVRKSNGVRYLLTAAHCATPPDRIYDPTGEYIGRAADERWEHDILLIQADAGSYIYDGGVGSGEFSKHVTTWQWAQAGTGVCTSGSVSGAICGIQTNKDNIFTACISSATPDSDGDYGYCVKDLWLAHRTNGMAAAQNGDSGGPVFTLDGTTSVFAWGTIFGTLEKDPSTLIFQDFGTAYRDFAITTA
jgi:streptogrisin D